MASPVPNDERLITISPAGNPLRETVFTTSSSPASALSRITELEAIKTVFLTGKI